MNIKYGSDMGQIERICLLLERFDSLMLTIEGLSQDAIKAGKHRIADYGGDNDYGNTYFIGTLDQIEKYLEGL